VTRKRKRTTAQERSPKKRDKASRPVKAAAKQEAKPPSTRPAKVRRKQSKRKGARLQATQETELELASEPGFDELISEEVPELGIGSRVVPPNARYESDALEGPPTLGPELSGNGDVAAQIRALEARLDGLIHEAKSEPMNPLVTREASDAGPGSGEVEVRIGSGAADLSQSEYYVQKWGRAGLRNRVEEVDDFGLDPGYEAKVRPFVDFLYKRYFRARSEGMSNIPNEGRCVIVANHSGALPLDGAMLKTAVRLEHPRARELRWLAEDFVFYLPFAGVFMNRVGAVRACQENAERLLEKDSLVAVFPEGVQGIKKHFSDRYRLQRFGRGGYIRLCLRMQAPLVPCAVIGAEEASPLFYRFETLSELLGLPYIPITPILPAPSRWKIKFGEPIFFDNYGPEAADDHLLVGRLSERVRSTIQGMLDSGLRERRSVWFG
jgi:1-acyl-sn-glycerol-3-phosphate acyltransferase